MRSTQLCYWFEGMAYYNDKREFFNGGLVLYKRDLNINSPKSKTHAEAKWYMRVKMFDLCIDRQTIRMPLEMFYELL